MKIFQKCYIILQNNDHNLIIDHDPHVDRGQGTGMGSDGSEVYMGKDVTPKNRAEQPKPRPVLRIRTLVLLVLIGIGALAGMALLNANARPNRDMQWYLKAGASRAVAPSMDESHDAAAPDEVLKTDAPEEPERVDAPDPADVADAVEPEKGVEEVPAGEQADVPAGEGSTADAEPVDSGEDDLTGQAEDEADVLADIPSDAQTPSGDGEVEAPPEETPDGPVTLTITAAGDCTFGGMEGSKGRRRFLQYVKEYGYDYFFESVRAIFENDDLTLVNLEGPLTSRTWTNRKEQFLFRGEPDYVNILTGSSVELCNLANNHSQDYGMDGLKETAKVLSDAGVGFCGYNQAYYATIKGVRVGALGYTWWQNDRKKIPSYVAEARKNCDLLIVSLHWGTEYKYQQDQLQQEMAHDIIDAGADLIIGTHPHVFQGIERYKGKYIVYSLGNFCFAGNADPSDKRCLIFQQQFSFTPGLGITQAGIQDEGINIIPTTVSSVKDYNDFKPTVLDAENGAKLLKSLAGHCEGLAAEDTLWMKDNYMEQNGLLTAQNASSEAADGEEAPAEQQDDGADPS